MCAVVLCCWYIISSFSVLSPFLYAKNSKLECLFQVLFPSSCNPVSKWGGGVGERPRRESSDILLYYWAENVGGGWLMETMWHWGWGVASVHVLSGSPACHNKGLPVFTLNCRGVAFCQMAPFKSATFAKIQGRGWGKAFCLILKDGGYSHFVHPFFSFQVSLWWEGRTASPSLPVSLLLLYKPLPAASQEIIAHHFVATCVLLPSPFSFSFSSNILVKECFSYLRMLAKWGERCPPASTLAVRFSVPIPIVLGECPSFSSQSNQ